MNLESEFSISKSNRRRVQEKVENPQHPFKIIVHERTRKKLEKRAHILERKAVKRK